ncbi:FBXO38 [Mytilus edulis]|uniref:FBXO38 n=1 Tax=Mytilus edulis TaxID=6550 RepID=A0A8S3VAP5_MYTED|nr:FBXO38 [Mytilus edulis]
MLTILSFLGPAVHSQLMKYGIFDPKRHKETYTDTYDLFGFKLDSSTTSRLQNSLPHSTQDTFNGSTLDSTSSEINKERYNGVKSILSSTKDTEDINVLEKKVSFASDICIVHEFEHDKNERVLSMSTLASMGSELIPDQYLMFPELNDNNNVSYKF